MFCHFCAGCITRIMMELCYMCYFCSPPRILYSVFCILSSVLCPLYSAPYCRSLSVVNRAIHMPGLTKPSQTGRSCEPRLLPKRAFSPTNHDVSDDRGARALWLPGDSYGLATVLILWIMQQMTLQTR